MAKYPRIWFPKNMVAPGYDQGLLILKSTTPNPQLKLALPHPLTTKKHCPTLANLEKKKRGYQR